MRAANISTAAEGVRAEVLAGEWVEEAELPAADMCRLTAFDIVPGTAPGLPEGMRRSDIGLRRFRPGKVVRLSRRGRRQEKTYLEAAE